MKKNALFITGMAGLVITAVTAAVAGYKTYPKVQKCKAEGKTKVETVKECASDYIPTAIAVAGTAAAFAEDDRIKDKANLALVGMYKNASGRYLATKTWYKDQTEAINSICSEDERKEINAEVSRREVARAQGVVQTEKLYTYRDPLTGVIFSGCTDSHIKLAIATINKELTLTGIAMLKDFYSLIGVKLPSQFINDGWSTATANAMWLDPWVEIAFQQHGPYRDIYYVNRSSLNGTMAFEPMPEPESDGWW